MRWVTDARGSGSGHVQGSQFTALGGPAPNAAGYVKYAQASGNFVLWAGRQRLLEDNLILEDTVQGEKFQMIYLPTWKKSSVSNVTWTPSGKLYFEQQNARRTLVAQCLVNVTQRECEYVRVITAGRPERK